MSIYLQSDSQGSLLIDAAVSYLTGQPLLGAAASSSNSERFSLSLAITSDGASIVSHQQSVAIGSSDNEIPISFDKLPPQLTPYNISVVGTLSHGNSHTTFSATTELYRLPQRTDGGSATRLDHLYGGISVVKGSQDEWKPVFPYTYYGEFWYTCIQLISMRPTAELTVSTMVPLLVCQYLNAGRICCKGLQCDSHCSHRGSRRHSFPLGRIRALSAASR